MKQNPESTWFGTKPVTPGQKTAAVQGVFTSVADQYDVMNDLMSFGVHRLWKDRFVRLALQGRRVSKIIDVAGGTGDIAFRLHRACQSQAHITVADLTPDMLRVGAARAIDRGILTGMTWQEANAEDLPFEDKTFDLYTIAFGLRNVTRMDQGLAEAYRVLKPGGRMACLEFSQVQDKVLNTGYQMWSRLIPHIGAVVAKDRDSYQYLVESIRAFPSQDQLVRRIKNAGFDAVRVVNLTGGVAAIHIAEKY